MIKPLLGLPIVCSPREVFVFKYFAMPPVGIAEGEPGTWYWRNPGQPPRMVCPRCGDSMPARGDVLDDGTLMEHVTCPNNMPAWINACDAHFCARLENYRRFA